MAKWLPDFRQGDTFRIKIEYPEGSSLIGYKHWLTLKTNFDAETATLAVESTFGEHSADDTNTAYLEALPADTADVEPGKYVYDVQAKAPNGDIVTLVPPVNDYTDRITVRPQVTTDAT